MNILFGKAVLQYISKALQWGEEKTSQLLLHNISFKMFTESVKNGHSPDSLLEARL